MKIKETMPKEIIDAIYEGRNFNYGEYLKHIELSPEEIAEPLPDKCGLCLEYNEITAPVIDLWNKTIGDETDEKSK